MGERELIWKDTLLRAVLVYYGIEDNIAKVITIFTDTCEISVNSV